MSNEANYPPEEIVSESLAEQRSAKKAQEAFIQQKLKNKKKTKEEVSQLLQKKIPSSLAPKSDKEPGAKGANYQGPEARSQPYGSWQVVETKK